jgi:hypothetical protein
MNGERSQRHVFLCRVTGALGVDKVSTESTRFGRPPSNDASHLMKWVFFSLSRSFENPKAVITCVEQMKLRLFAKHLADGHEQL